MKILISCLFYENCTGSELYVFDLAHALLRRGHDISVHAQDIGGQIFERTDERIRVSPRQTSKTTPDLVLAQHHVFSKDLIENTDAPVVYTCHSEKLPDEFPIKHPKIKKYIAVRQAIADFMVEEGEITADKIEVVPNGVDLNRFKPSDKPKKYGFIPANVTLLRMPFIERLMEEYPTESLLFSGFGTGLLPNKPNLLRKDSQWEIEEFYDEAKWVAGLFQGRTQYEAWACGLEFKSYYWDGTPYPMERPDNFEEIYGLEKVVDTLEDIYKRSII